MIFMCIRETVVCGIYCIFSNLIRAPFYSFRGAKKSYADYNRVRIRFAVERWIFGKMMEPLYVP